VGAEGSGRCTSSFLFIFSSNLSLGIPHTRFHPLQDSYICTLSIRFTLSPIWRCTMHCDLVWGMCLGLGSGKVEAREPMKQCARAPVVNLVIRATATGNPETLELRISTSLARKFLASHNPVELTCGIRIFLVAMYMYYVCSGCANHELRPLLVISLFQQNSRI
jgi:hypothetical protein